MINPASRTKSIELSLIRKKQLQVNYVLIFSKKTNVIIRKYYQENSE